MVHHDATTSTNDVARRLGASGAAAGTVVLAEEQTGGRGRQGRRWAAPRGRSLTLSVLVRDEPAGAPLLPLASALAVCEACELIAAVQCLIKWPNDVLVDGRKIAGILIEARPQERWAVVGIGLNVDTDEHELEPELRVTAGSLRIATGSTIDRERVLEALLDALSHWIGPGAAHSGDRVVAAYAARDALRGRRIAWSAGDRQLEGEAAGIDEAGNLVVFLDGGERVLLDAGEVHLGSESL